MKLKGKIALVTGSSRGIGKDIAESFANEGANVIITYKQNKLSAERVAKKLPNSYVTKLDILKKNSIDGVVKKILKKYGRIDILVNNAGINKPADFEDITEDDWNLILDTNLKGSFFMSQKVFEIMKTQNFGRIINIASISGQYGGPRTAHYAVSKAGLISLGHCIARFGGKYNITCNNISPGIITTEMSKNIMSTKLGRKIIENTIIGRPGTTSEIAKTAIFLASDDSSYISGQTINVNGGLLLS